MRRRRSPLTEAPEDLTPAQWQQLSGWVASRQPWAAAELEELVEHCLDHHRGRGNYMADWLAACRTWVRNERLWRQRRPGGGSGGATRQSPRSGVAAAAEQVARDLGLFGPLD